MTVARRPAKDSAGEEGQPSVPELFPPIDLLHFQAGVASYMAALGDDSSLDPDFPDTTYDPITGEVTPMKDTPVTRAAYKAGRLFPNSPERMSFVFRVLALLPIAFSPRYDRYRDDKDGTMHAALMMTMAYMPCTPRMTLKAHWAEFDKTFRQIVPRIEALGDTLH